MSYSYFVRTPLGVANVVGPCAQCAAGNHDACRMDWTVAFAVDESVHTQSEAPRDLYRCSCYADGKCSYKRPKQALWRRIFNWLRGEPWKR
jgi:hypothetical protein